MLCESLELVLPLGDLDRTPPMRSLVLKLGVVPAHSPDLELGLLGEAVCILNFCLALPLGVDRRARFVDLVESIFFSRASAICALSRSLISRLGITVRGDSATGLFWAEGSTLSVLLGRAGLDGT